MKKRLLAMALIIAVLMTVSVSAVSARGGGGGTPPIEPMSAPLPPIVIETEMDDK